ncbi:unnamed protein product, partial [Thlaspi arvense]
MSSSTQNGLQSGKHNSNRSPESMLGEASPITFSRPRLQPPFKDLPPCAIPHEFSTYIPQGIAVRGSLWQRVVNDPRFEFTKQTDSRHHFYMKLLRGYFKALMPSLKLSKDGASTETVLDDFFSILLSQGEKEKQDGVEMGVMELLAFEYFANTAEEELPQPPGYLTMVREIMNPPGTSSDHCLYLRNQKPKETKLSMKFMRQSYAFLMSGHLATTTLCSQQKNGEPSLPSTNPWTMASFNHCWLSSPLAETPTFFFFSPSPQPKSLKLSVFRNKSSPLPNSSSPDRSPEVELAVDPVKLALKKAEAYKKSKSELKKPERNAEELLKLAKQKADDYKKQKELGADGVTEAKPSSTEQSFVRSSNKVDEENDGKKKELKVSSIDFVGLGFADKKSTRGLPPGLVPVVDYFPGGDLPEVEFIVGDKARFAETEKELEQEGNENSDVYKPKVSTWGVFPRPSNISKTFGGGRTIQPGDSVETAEERTAREERTKQLLTAYKESIGLNIDPKLKLECEEALEKGNSLMDSGKLKEALPYYEKVMEKIVFKSELHGLAALQWSICQDSLRKEKKARGMYEKLLSHPNPRVSKKARQFMFSFQAMEMLKVQGSSYMQINPGYENYFEAFVKKDKIDYKAKEEEGEALGINETLLYVILLASPILLIFIVAAQRGNVH